MTIEEVSLRPPQSDEVEVVIDACAICHSDISYMDGAWEVPLPAVFGHEAAGRIVSIGDGIDDFSVDGSVLVTLLKNCGKCQNCKSGMPARCERKASPADTPISDSDGLPVAKGLATAAFAERVIAHKTQIAKIPHDMPRDTACVVSCGVITGVGSAVNTAAVTPGSSVVVIGAGGVGLNAIQGARICGASRIIAVDILESKLEDARQFGATDVVLGTKEKLHHRIREINGGRGVDFVLVSVGSAQACEAGLRCLCPGGKLIIVGMPPSGEVMKFEPVVITYLSQRIEGSAMGDTVLGRDIPWLLEHYRQGRLKIDQLVTGRYPLSRINEAVEDTRRGNARRNVIVFDQ